MTRILETSDFLGLTTMMCVGLYQETIVASGASAPGWMVGGHAHLGVLSILAVVMGFAVDAFDLSGRLRTAVTGLYVTGQWLLPVTLWVGIGGGMTFLMPTTLLWGLFLVVSVLLMAWQAWTGPSTGSGRDATGAALADD